MEEGKRPSLFLKALQRQVCGTPTGLFCCVYQLPVPVGRRHQRVDNADELRANVYIFGGDEFHYYATEDVSARAIICLKKKKMNRERFDGSRSCK